MSIKAIIIDLSGTLVSDHNGKLVSPFDIILPKLKEMGLHIAIASNNPIRGEALAQFPVSPDLQLTRNTVGSAKGSGQWVKKVCIDFDIKPNQVVYLGNSNNDMVEALNSRVIYLNAEWANPQFRYGIPVKTPDILPYYLKHFFGKDNLWYWSIDCSDGNKQGVCSRALIDKKTIGITSFDSKLWLWAKENSDSQIDSLRISEFVIFSILGSLYSEGLYADIDGWVVIPGHKPETQNESLNQTILRVARLFRHSFYPELLFRHKTSKDSGITRAAGESMNFYDQVTTMCLKTDNRKESIANKTIVMFDDFVTQGFTSEWARNLLLNAGAKRVISLAIGAYHTAIDVKTIKSDFIYDSFQPITIDNKFDAAVSSKSIAACLNHEAIGELKEAYKILSACN